MPHTKNNKYFNKSSRTTTISVDPDYTADGHDWQSVHEYIEGSFDVDRYLTGHGSCAYQYSSDCLLYP